MLDPTAEQLLAATNMLTSRFPTVIPFGTYGPHTGFQL